MRERALSIDYHPELSAIAAVHALAFRVLELAVFSIQEYSFKLPLPTA